MRVCITRLGLRFLDVRENAFAPLKVALAALCHRKAARGPVQQTCLEVGFKIRHRTRRLSRGRVELLRGCGETACFYHAHEQTHALKRIHKTPKNSLYFVPELSHGRCAEFIRAVVKMLCIFTRYSGMTATIESRATE
jgi:hypothetical protein